MNFFEMRWPVLDEDRTALELIAEADEDLAAELPKLRLRALSAPVYSWHHAPGTMRLPALWLVARLAVTDESIITQAVTA